jgi:membrane protease YdiL (CAAX protease family)
LNRVANLDRRGLVLGVVAIAIAVFAAGLVYSPVPYTDPRFAIEFFTTEVVVTGLLTVATVAFFPADRLGLRAPPADRLKGAWPLGVLVLAAVLARAAAVNGLPDGVVVDPDRIGLVLRTTALVGINEEWIFRGLLPAALCRWLGFRRGVYASLLAFGAFHLINLLGGVSPVQAALQFVNTTLLGAVFMVAALATRSLVLPMIGHAVYDFAVIDAQTLAAAGADNTAMIGVPLIGLALGVWCVWRLSRLTGEEPYA